MNGDRPLHDSQTTPSWVWAGSVTGAVQWEHQDGSPDRLPRRATGTPDDHRERSRHATRKPPTGTHTSAGRITTRQGHAPGPADRRRGHRGRHHELRRARPVGGVRDEELLGRVGDGADQEDRVYDDERRHHDVVPGCHDERRHGGGFGGGLGGGIGVGIGVQVRDRGDLEAGERLPVGRVDNHVGTELMSRSVLETITDGGDGRSETAEGLIATRSIRAIGTTAVVIVTDPALADDALGLLAEDMTALDEACSRFRSDSEIRRLEERSHGRPVAVSPLLFEALAVASAVAEQTGGTVDPTTGSALIELGYDRDFAELSDEPAGTSADRPEPAPGWWQISLDAEARTVAVPDGVHVDLGSTAKAFAADRTAQRIADTLGCGVLVNLGGDVSLAGQAPKEGWAIGIGARSTTPSDEVDLVLAVSAGALATSGTTSRVWFHHGRQMHHIVDPWTGEPADPVWTVVSVLAPTCVEANAWSTAAVVWGKDAPGNLAARGVAARLVGADGNVVTVGGWPTDPVVAPDEREMVP